MSGGNVHHNHMLFFIAKQVMLDSIVNTPLPSLSLVFRSRVAFVETADNRGTDRNTPSIALSAGVRGSITQRLASATQYESRRTVREY